MTSSLPLAGKLASAQVATQHGGARLFLTDGFAASGSSAGVRVARARVADGLLAGIRVADDFAVGVHVVDGFVADGFAVGVFSADAFPAGYLLNMSCAGLQPSGIVCLAHHLAALSWCESLFSVGFALFVGAFSWRVRVLLRRKAAR